MSGVNSKVSVVSDVELEMRVLSVRLVSSVDIDFGLIFSFGWEKWASVGCRKYPIHGPYA